MSATAERATLDVPQEAPTAQLPAIRQERRPRAPAAPKPAAYPASIARSILKIAGEIGRIQKDGRNEFQKYKYARWEDVNEKLSPLLTANGLIITQSEINRSLLEENEKGSVLAIVYHFTIINADGEQWPEVEWTGIARLRDGKGVTDDKAAAKCHTQAEKFFCLKQFKIVTDDALDRDDRHASLPKKDARDIYTKLQKEIDEHTSLVELGAWGSQNTDRIKALPPDWQDILRERYAEKKAELENKVVSAPGQVWEDAHDPETGEVLEDSAARPSAADQAAPALSSQGTAGAADFASAQAEEMIATMKKSESAAALVAWSRANKAVYDALPDQERAQVNTEYRTLMNAFAAS